MNGHLSGASSFKKVCEYYNCLRILFTGSPARLDGKPLELADKMVIGITARELIKQGKISDYNYYAPDINLDLSNVRKVNGDFNNQQLGEVMSNKKIYGDIIKYYNMLGEGRQALAYCVNINHAKEVCEMFNNSGITAKEIDSKTPEKEREKIMDEFKDGKFKILCNCNLISEGITLPNCEVGLLLRPTCSLPLFIQQSMRPLTPVEGKKAIIIDYVNNVQRHGLPTMDRKWSLTNKVQEYDNENDDGTLKIRICQECFSTFQTAPKCPYCGAEYKTTPIEIQNFKEIKLKKIEEEKEAKRQAIMQRTAENIANYTKPEQCRNFYELVEFGKKRGYKPGWAVFQAKRLHLMKG
ncbi:MAG: hypothetical protein MR691_08475 [Clostridium sp.]|nr:hypothetical protein [Clostridium sp.]